MTCKKVKFAEVGHWLSFKPKTSFFGPKMRFKQEFIFVYDSMTTSRTHDTHPEEVINRAKIDVGRPGSFGEVRTTHRQNRALYE